jgi:hypothetical protein
MEYLPIGTSVRVDGQYIRKKKMSGFRRLSCWWQFVPVEAFHGVVVGGVYLHDGESYYDPEEGAEFLITETKFAYKIVKGFLNKPVFVPPAFAVEVSPKPIPKMDVGWTERARKEMSLASKAFPRDSKGRFTR